MDITIGSLKSNRVVMEWNGIGLKYYIVWLNRITAMNRSGIDHK